MRKIATKLQECADLLQEKVKNLDAFHGTQQIEDIAQALREHSKVIKQLADQIRDETEK